MEQLLGLILHTIGGFSSASFYVPTYQIKQWAWETYWILLGFVAWIVMPAVGCLLVTSQPMAIWASLPASSLGYTWLFGALWGFGGLFSGLGLRYLGLALGQSVSLGVSSIIGTLIPAMVSGQIQDLWSTPSGRIITVGLLISILGIVSCGLAGHLKEQVLKETSVPAGGEFFLSRGLLFAVIGGVMSACMAIAILFGGPIAEASIAVGTKEIFRNIPIFVIAFAGGFTTNAIYAGVRSRGKNTLRVLFTPRSGVWARNYLLSILAGVMWYLQFFFYGMGATRMGDYEFASWSLHMSSIVIFSNLWGLWLKEWKGVPRQAIRYLGVGILLLIISILLIGWRNL